MCTGTGKDYATTPKIVLQGKWLWRLAYCKEHFPGHQAIVCTHPDGHKIS